MTVRFLLVAIDDERPLGPQMRAALSVLPWKVVRELAGNAYSLRWLRRLVESSDFSERHAVRFGGILPAHARPGEGDVMAGILGGGQQGGGYTPQPSPPQIDDSAAQEAARKERLADAKATGRSATILTDFALATKTPNTLKPTLGA